MIAQLAQAAPTAPRLFSSVDNLPAPLADMSREDLSAHIANLFRLTLEIETTIPNRRKTHERGKQNVKR
jgi:hypothetical protein